MYLVIADYKSKKKYGAAEYVISECETIEQAKTERADILAQFPDRLNGTPVIAFKIED